jgi:hypothetical protein
MVLDDGEEERRRQPTPRLITALAHQDKITAARGQQVESSTAGMLCAGCSVEGRAPMIVNDDRPVLRPAFGWGDPPRTAMLCALYQPASPPKTRGQRQSITKQLAL